MKRLALCVVGLFLAVAVNAQIAQWTFETSTPATAGPFAAEVGTGQALGFHVGAAVYSSPVGNGSSHSFSANTWAVGDYYQFQTSTIGFSAIAVSWDQTSSSTGPNMFNLEYSTDGTTFTTFLANYLVKTNATSSDNEGTGWATAPWSSGGSRQAAYGLAIDFSSVSALNNASSVYFRLVDNNANSALGTPVSAAGTDRVDNFTIFTIVPEPASAALAGLGFLGLLIQRKRD
jgi:hypothetical protein